MMLEDKPDYKVKGILAFLVVLISFIIYRDYIFREDYYIFFDAASDTVTSYVPYLIYISNMLHSFNFETWSFEIGLGTDLFSLGSLLTDPFNLIFFVLGEKYIYSAIVYVAILKSVLASIFFYTFLNNFQLMKFSKLIFSLFYAFNGYIILWGQHYHLATAVVLLPLILHYFEKWLQEKKTIGLVIIVFISSVYGYAYLYMVICFMAIYIIVRYLMLNKLVWKSLIIFVAKTSGLFLLGLGLSAIVFIPSVLLVLNSPRLGAFSIKQVLVVEELDFYLTLFTRFFTNSISILGQFSYSSWINYYESPIVYCGLFTLIILPFLLLNYAKKYNGYIVLLIISVIALFIPVFSYILTGLSAVYYRWTFLLVPVLLLVAANVMEDLFNSKYKKNVVIISLFYILTLLIAILTMKYKYSWDGQDIHSAINYYKVIVVILMLYTFILVFWGRLKRFNLNKFLLIMLVAIELVIQSDAVVTNRVTLSTEHKLQEVSLFDSDYLAVEEILKLDKEFYRIDKIANNEFIYTKPLIHNYASTSAFNSLNNSSYVSFLQSLNINSVYSDNTNVTKVPSEQILLQSLLGVKYLITDTPVSYPGYGFIKEVNNDLLYINTNAMPVGIIQNKFITKENFDKLPLYMKETILYEAVVINPMSEYQNYGLTELSIEDIEIDPSDLLDITSVTAHNANLIESKFPDQLMMKPQNYDPQIVFQLNTEYSGEIYVSFEYTSESDSVGQIFWSNNESGFDEPKSIKFDIEEGNKVYHISLGNIVANSIRLDFSGEETNYSVTDIKFYTVQTNYEEQIGKLKDQIEQKQANGIDVKSYSNSNIKGDITVSDNGVLVFSIPYDKGWGVLVNGVYKDTFEVNNGMIGVALETGEYEIELTYRTYGLLIGAIISLIILILVIVLLVYLPRRRKLKLNN